jgi:glycosyltransferase involved in cell wall biosynthesis
MDIRILQGDDARKGIGVYTRGLVEALLPRAGDLGLKVFLFIDPRLAAPEVDIEGAAEVVPVTLTGKRGWLSRRTPPAAEGLSQAAKHRGAQVLHVCSPLHGPFDWEPLRGADTAATVYDLIPLLDRPHYLDRWPVSARRRYQARLRSLKSLSAIFAISASVAEDVARHAGVSRDRITVAYPGSRARLSEGLGEADREPRRSVLAFGSLNPSKNTNLLVRAYARVAPELRQRHRLRLVGPDSPEWRTWIQRRLPELGIADDVDSCFAVPDADLNRFYGHAALVVIPSRAEGFGLPALEAMARGAPVVVSNIPVLREVVGDAGITFDPEGAEALAKVVERVLQDPAEQKALSETGMKRAAMFSWRETAETVARVYLRLARP